MRPTATPRAVASSAVAVTPDSTLSEAPASPSLAPHIGIVAGHSGHDIGASCPDGLAEVEVNLDVAQRVVDRLRELGYRVDLLEEYDSRLERYLADALVSIHADSCQQLPDATPPPSGFKVASVVDSVVPDEESLLVACLTERYGERTGLGFHANSITGHMTQYHTFYEIDPHTPGAIIETGFMWLDRELLTQDPDRVAHGIVDGIVCFIEGEGD
ncbi:MAG: N-acetylmuramoyl-L-alanine amidase [Anaerolineae bacterium]